MQLCVLRYLGWTLSDIKVIPENILNYIAGQINVNPKEYQFYAKREATRYEHLDEICREYDYHHFSPRKYRRLLKNLYDHAMANGNPIHLIQTALDLLRKWKIILPAMATIERAVWETRRRTEEKIFLLLSSSLTPAQTEILEQLVQTMLGSTKTYLAWLKEVPGKPSPEAFLKIIKRLEYIRQLNLNVDTKGIHPNRLRQLSRLGARYEPFLFRRFKDPKKYAMLVAYLLDLSQDLIDHAFEIHDKQIANLQKKGKKTRDELQKKNGKSINEKVFHFASLGDALIKARNEGTDPYKALEMVMPWENIVASVEEAKNLSRPVDYDYLDLLENSFSYLRRYTPTLLKALEFRCTKSTEPLLKALDVIREMNETGKRKVPEEAPLNFISNRWQKHVYDEDGNINRHYYEMAVLTELRNSVRSGDVSIVGSRQHKDFDEYLVSREEWEVAKSTGTKLTVSLSVDEYLEERTNTLLNRLNWINKNIKDLEGVSLEKGKLHIQRLEKDVPDGARQFSLSLYVFLVK